MHLLMHLYQKREVFKMLLRAKIYSNFLHPFSNFPYFLQKILAWVTSYILSASQYFVPIPIFLSCIAHCNTDKNVMHTVLSPIILSPRACPIVNIRGHLTHRQISETNISIIATSPEQEPIPKRSHRFIISGKYLP